MNEENKNLISKIDNDRHEKLDENGGAKGGADSQEEAGGDQYQFASFDKDAAGSSEERYRTFITQSTEGIWRIELTEPIPLDSSVEQMVELAYERGFLAECNDAMARMYGFEKAEDLRGTRLADLFVREDPANEEYLRSFFESGFRLTDAESHEKSIDGEDKYFSNNLVGFIENGQLVRAWGTQRDITRRKRIEEELRDSREQYRALFNSIDEGFCVLEMIFDDAGKAADYRFLEINPSFEKQTGIKSSEALDGRTVLEIIPNLERHWIEIYGRVALTGVTERFISGSDVMGRWFDVFAFRIGDAGSRKVALLFTDITARRRDEAALRESEKRFRNMADNAPVMIWVTDAAGHCNFLSQSWYEFTGQTPEEGLGLGWIDAVHPDDRRAAEESFLSSNEKRAPFSIEYRFRRKDGEYRWAIDSAQPRFGDNDEYLGYVGSVVDIHERRTAAEKIRESEATLRAFYNSSPLLMGVVELPEDNDGDVVHLYDNAAASQFFGVPEGMTVNRRASELGSPGEVIELWTTNYRKSARLGRPVTFDYAQGGDENSRRLSVTVSPLGAAPSGRTRFAYVAEDTTEWHQAHEKLIAAERRAAAEYQELLSRIVPLAQTLGTARDLLSVYRAVGEFVRSSMPCSAFFVSFFDAENSLRSAAYAWGEGEEINISALPPMPIAEDGGPNSRAILNRRPVVTEAYMDEMKNRPHVIVGDDDKNPDSSLVVPMIVMNRVVGTLEVQAHENKAFVAEHTIALEMVGNLAAVAIENVRLLEAEAALRRDAEAATRAKDEFIAVVSHELRSPLNAILGWTRILQSNSENVDRAAALEIIVRNARAQSKLIEDLLDTARISSGKLQLETRRLDVADSVIRVVEMTNPAAAAKNVRLEIEAERAFGEVEGDPDRLRQIFENLLSNALKFTPAGGAIKVRVERDEESAKITVADSGQGISPEFLPLIFERFRQADPASTRRHGGLGIGLALTKQLVEMHGGTIAAESEGIGRGATFTVRLPIAA